ncbi:hypothetical protein [Alicyclobacillus fastidiosus]|uniref:Fatty acid hydroxylase domain-containing protein n=1 Tax=Alicyclobacillus fastidiosus TaxID=392011 RepID=A0ABV5AP62_9BACL|nr:hypothetical protein [Alicyclobacillus fastidiosus]WEH08428.1 hypothetical protein PYS47_17265 [Alicyclobacillus fastidiosus]
MFIYNSIVLLMVLLVVWKGYKRARILIGWQPVWRIRVWGIVALLVAALVLVLMVVASIYFATHLFLLHKVKWSQPSDVGTSIHSVSWIFDIIGIFIGCLSAIIAIHTTQFEMRNGDWHYKSNVYISLGVLVIFVAWIAFRIDYIYWIVQHTITVLHSIHHRSAAHGALSENEAQAKLTSEMKAQVITQLPSYFEDPWVKTPLMFTVSYYVYYFGTLLYKSRHLKLTKGLFKQRAMK